MCPLMVFFGSEIAEPELTPANPKLTKNDLERRYFRSRPLDLLNKDHLYLECQEACLQAVRKTTDLLYSPVRKADPKADPVYTIADPKQTSNR